MAGKEHPLVWYCRKNQNFAELIDGWLFHGKGRVRSEDLSDIDRRFLARSKGKVYRERYRDLYKQADGMAFRLLIGIEQQEHVNYIMPVRIMDYDCISYMAQREEISGRHKEQKDLRDDEWLSGFSKDDRLLPVISLVLYWGMKPWDAATSLHEILNFDKVPTEARKYIADYKIHVLDVCHTPDERLMEFSRDIYALFLFFKYKNDPEGLMKKLKNTKDIRTNTYEAIADCMGEQRLKKFKKNRKRGKVNLCKAIDMMITDGEKRGFEKGEKQGFILGVESEQKNTARERRRAEEAEARVRELQEMLKQ